MMIILLNYVLVGSLFLSLHSGFMMERLIILCTLGQSVGLRTKEDGHLVDSFLHLH